MADQNEAPVESVEPISEPADEPAAESTTVPADAAEPADEPATEPSTAAAESVAESAAESHSDRQARVEAEVGHCERMFALYSRGYEGLFDRQNRALERLLTCLPPSPAVEPAAAEPRKLIKEKQIKDTLVDFKVSGKKGEMRWATHTSQILFRGEKLAAIDDSNRPGFGTRIMMTLVGNKLQTPVPDRNGEFVGGTPTAFYASNALGNGLTLKSCNVGQSIRYLIYFEEDCTWEAALFGKMIEDYYDPFDDDVKLPR